MIDELQHEADALLAAGDYAHALPEFCVLREIRARQDGPYSTKYLANLHDAVRCMCHLQKWSDSEPLARELYGKYVRMNGPGGPKTVDAAKRYAWALVQLEKTDPAIAVYLSVADALWGLGDEHQALAMLGAAVARRQDLDLHSLRNADHLGRAALAVHLPVPAECLTMDGYRAP
ncbi:hypothetical protein [Williamsia deligens]|uniref:Tetratricopeptide repeat protein n=1 Tax=Williamsia deligens TaxID=321325 RepID=A0ABW3G7T3_9NOCA|nr:hypothetical protein [Williamsia deligens]